MKRSILALAGIALGLSLTACGGGSVDTDPATTDRLFVSAVHSITDSFDGVEDADLAQAGHETCAELREHGFVKTDWTLQVNGMSPEQRGSLIAASVKILCDDQMGAFQTWVDADAPGSTVEG